MVNPRDRRQHGQGAHSLVAVEPDAGCWCTDRSRAWRWENDRLARSGTEAERPLSRAGGCRGAGVAGREPSSNAGPVPAHGCCYVIALDGLLARTCGELCGAAGTSDVIDASVVVVARQQREPIITGDADALKR